MIAYTTPRGTTPETWPSREDHSAFAGNYGRARKEIDAFIEAVNAHFDGGPPG